MLRCIISSSVIALGQAATKPVIDDIEEEPSAADVGIVELRRRRLQLEAQRARPDVLVEGGSRWIGMQQGVRPLAIVAGRLAAAERIEQFEGLCYEGSRSGSVGR